MTLSRRSGSGEVRYPRTAVHIVAAALAVTAMSAAIWAGPAASASDHHHRHAAAASPHRGSVEYYIVQPPENGHKEFLYEIAVKTLGSGRRAMEIFELNKGRLQPGGGRMESPGVIEPGWILVLPVTASGPDVHYGPLPVVTRSPASPAAASPPSVLHRTSRAAAGAAGASRSRSLRVSKRTVITGGAILLALLLGVCLVVVLRRRRKAHATRRPVGVEVTALPAPGPQAGLPAGSTPHEPGGNGPAQPYPIPPMAGPDHRAEPDHRPGPQSSRQARSFRWARSSRRIPDHRTGSGSGSGTSAWPDAGDPLDRPAAWRATPAATGDAGGSPWPDYLMPGVSHLATPEHSGRSVPAGAGPVPGPPLPADADTGDARGDAEASGPEAGDRDVTAEVTSGPPGAPPDEGRPQAAGPQRGLGGSAAPAAFSPGRPSLDGVQGPSAQLAGSADAATPELQAISGDDRINVAGAGEQAWPVTEIPPDEPAVRALSVEDGKPAPGVDALAAPAAAAVVAGAAAGGDRGRGSVRRNQWSAPPAGLAGGDSGRQDEADPSDDRPIRNRVRPAGLRIAALAAAVVLVCVIGSIAWTIVSQGSHGVAARHAAQAGQRPSARVAGSVAGSGQLASPAPLAGIIPGIAVTPLPVEGRTIALHGPRPPTRPRAPATSPQYPPATAPQNKPATPAQNRPASAHRTPASAHRTPAKKAAAAAVKSPSAHLVRPRVPAASPASAGNWQYGMFSSSIQVTPSQQACLDDWNDTQNNYNLVVAYPCSHSDIAQFWAYDSSNHTIHATGASGQALNSCLDVYGGGRAAGTPVDLYPCNNTGAQVWQHLGNGELVNPQSGNCLDIPNYGQWTPVGGPPVQMHIWDCNGGPWQQWKLA